MNLKFFIKINLVIILFFTVFPYEILSQDSGKDPVEIARAHYNFARLMADNLSERLNLNINQKKVVIEILIDYQENLLSIYNEVYQNSPKNNSQELGNTNELVGKISKVGSSILEETGVEADEQIESILNRNQLSKYYRVKSEWWNRLNTVALYNF